MTSWLAVVVVTSALLFHMSRYVEGFQNLFGGGGRVSIPSFTTTLPTSKEKQRRQMEDNILQAIQEEGNRRLANSDDISKLVLELEESGLSIPEPAIAPQVYGRWRLMYTTNAATGSPIQRSAVNSQQFPIYQDIKLVVVDNDSDNGPQQQQQQLQPQLQVNQIVQFSKTAELKVVALASTAAYPLAELTERKSTGKILGFNLLGVSLVGEEAKPDPNRPNSRIDFVFDSGVFDFGSLQVPYPVPFRLPILRDTVKGWIDVTYLSDRFRISRGNKGTTFILVKEEEEEQKQL
jgi:predicted  nucleic acid-binding Zn ribbon protein